MVGSLRNGKDFRMAWPQDARSAALKSNREPRTLTPSSRIQVKRSEVLHVLGTGVR